MPRKDKKLQRVVDAEYTPVAPEPTPAQTEELLNLEDVQFMIIAGRKKDGQPFFHSVNLPDFFVIDGLLEFAKRKLNRTYGEFFDKEKKE